VQLKSTRHLQTIARKRRVRVRCLHEPKLRHGSGSATIGN
jgi:hypothetical protein